MVRGDLYISLVGKNGFLKYKQILLINSMWVILCLRKQTFILTVGLDDCAWKWRIITEWSIFWVDSIPYSDLVMHWNFSLLAAFPSMITKLSLWQVNKCYHTYLALPGGRRGECTDAVCGKEDGHCNRNIEISDNILILLFRFPFCQCCQLEHI